MDTKILKQLLESIDVLSIVGDVDKTIVDVTCDSRTVKRGASLWL